MINSTCHQQRSNVKKVFMTDQRASGCCIGWRNVLAKKKREREIENKMGVWLCIWASRCPLTADHWHLNSYLCESCSVSPLRSIRHKSAWVYGEKQIYMCVCVVQFTQTSVVISDCIVLGLNHTSAKCEFYQIIRVLNHCLVLTDECERGNKLLHRVGACVCVCVCAYVRDRFRGDLRCHRAANHNLLYSVPTSQHEQSAILQMLI